MAEQDSKKEVPRSGELSSHQNLVPTTAQKLHNDAGTGQPSAAASYDKRIAQASSNSDTPTLFDTTEPGTSKNEKGDSEGAQFKPTDGKSPVSPSLADTVYGGPPTKEQVSGKRVEPIAKTTYEASGFTGASAERVATKPQGQQTIEAKQPTGITVGGDGQIVPKGPAESKVTAGGNQQGLGPNAGFSDGGGVSRPANAQRGEQSLPQNKGTGLAQGDKVGSGDNTGIHKPDASPSTVGAAYMPPGRKDDAIPGNTGTRPSVAESAIGNANTGAKFEGKSDGKSLVTEGSANALGGQPRADLKGELTSGTSTTGQHKYDSTKGEPQSVTQGKPEPVRGIDVSNTQGAGNPTVRAEGARIGESKVEGGKSVEPQGSRDAGTLRDPKSAGVTNEVFGQKAEVGQRGEVSPSAGVKPDSRTAEQITKGIESRVNDGPKAPSGADSRGPTSSEGAGGSRQPGTTDGATAGTRQPVAEAGGKSQGITDGAQPSVKQTNPSDVVNTGKQPSASDGASTGTSSNIRQPMSDVGDKGTSGGGGSVTAESTRKIDVGIPQGGKAEGQPGSGGMGGGSSAPIDRAPHAPFKVEEAQPSGAKVDAGLKAESGGKGEAAGGGKSPAVGDGTRFDSGEMRGNQPGARFDTAETRGTQPGTRFDTGEIKDGRSGITTGGKSGDAGGVIGAESGTIKGADVSGVKASTGGGHGIGGSSGSGSADAAILGDKRQPSMLPDSPATPGGKPGKPGDGIASGQVNGDDSVPFVLPGGFGGKDGGRRQSDQMFGDKTKGSEASGNKPEPGASAGKAEPGSMIAKFDGLVSGKTESNAPGNRIDAAGIKADKEQVGEAGQKAHAGQKAQAGQKPDTGQKADAGIPAAMAGQVGSGAAEVGNVLKNFAQTVLSDGKSGVTNDGPGQKTRILDSTVANSDTKVVGGTGGDDKGGTSIDEFSLPEVDLLGESGNSESIEEIAEVEESEKAKGEDEMHYELALGLQLYTSISESQYGVYHYLTKEGDTVEGVARNIVGDGRTAPLVFSLNKEHILASTEYGVHPFKVGVMVQLPTPRDLKNFFGTQHQ